MIPKNLFVIIMCCGYFVSGCKSEFEKLDRALNSAPLDNRFETISFYVAKGHINYALMLLDDLEKLDDIEAFYRLGNYYLYGPMTIRNLDKAEKYILKCVKVDYRDSGGLFNDLLEIRRIIKAQNKVSDEGLGSK